MTIHLFSSLCYTVTYHFWINEISWKRLLSSCRVVTKWSTVVCEGMNNKNVCGNETESKREVIRSKYQIVHSTVNNRGGKELTRHNYNKLRLPQRRPILVDEVTKNQTANKEKITQNMFKTFNTPAMMWNRAFLSMTHQGEPLVLPRLRNWSLTLSHTIKVSYWLHTILTDSFN